MLPSGAALSALHALTRRFHGHSLCDELGLPRAAAADALLTPAINGVRSHRARMRRDRVAWDRQRETHLAEARKALHQQQADHTAYQHAAQSR